MNASKEDYLREIYTIAEKNHGKVRSIDIAKRLGISRPSVSDMLRKLEELKLVQVKKDKSIQLTVAGRKSAKKIVHNHRVIEVFLTDMLGFPVSKAHDEAHKLEHAFSKESIKKLDDLLENPKVSPHLNRIPHGTNNGYVRTVTLDKLQKGEEARVMQVCCDSNLKQRIQEMGVVKGTKVKVLKVAPLGDPMQLKILGYHLTLRKNEAKTITVAI